jgi:hypothetical protein
MGTQASSSEAFPHRICVVGTTGSGKSTMAEALSQRLHIPHIELDSLTWEPGWKEVDHEVTRARLKELVRNESWVIDGNYRYLRDILWPRAQAVIWLDYPLGLILWRLWWRTWKRVLSQEVLWGTNKERLAEQFFSRESLFLWAFKTYGRHKKQYPLEFMLPEHVHLRVFRFSRPQEAAVFLDCLPLVNPEIGP